MIRIIDIRKLALVAALSALGAVGCTQQVTDNTSTQDDDVRDSTMGAELSDGTARSSSSIGVPATAAHPTARRLGPQPDPWKSADGPPQGPQPDPWSGRSGDGSGTGNSTPKPGDPSNPNQ